MKNNWKNKKVVVTGASGFIGSNIVGHLVKKGADVTAVVSLKHSHKKLLQADKDIESQVKIIKADILDLTQCVKFLKNQEFVLNFAAVDGGTNFKKKYPVEIFNANTKIISNVLDASVKNNLKKILLISSSEIYSPDLKGMIKEEAGFTGLPSGVVEGYAWSKRTTEILARLYANEFGLNIAIARPSNVYGPNDYADSEKGRVIPTFIMQALNNQDITIWGNGLTKKSFLYVDDLSRSLLSLTEEYAVCDPVNLASEKQVSIKNLAKLVIKLTQSKSRIKHIKTPFVKSDRRIISTKKAQSIINFHEDTDLEQGLLKTIASFK